MAADKNIEYMSQRNSILAHIARIASKIRTRQSDIKTHFISGDIPGPVQFSLVLKLRFIHHCCPQEVMSAATVVKNFLTLHNGMFAPST